MPLCMCRFSSTEPRNRHGADMIDKVAFPFLGNKKKDMSGIFSHLIKRNLSGISSPTHLSSYGSLNATCH